MRRATGLDEGVRQEAGAHDLADQVRCRVGPVAVRNAPMTDGRILHELGQSPISPGSPSEAERRSALLSSEELVRARGHVIPRVFPRLLLRAVALGSLRGQALHEIAWSTLVVEHAPPVSRRREPHAVDRRRR
jgi:hypothetical protein